MKRTIKIVVISLGLMLVITAIYWFFIHPNTYKYNTAIKNGDVVIGSGGLVNVDKFHTFIKKVEDKQPDKIRITAYSKEGYPTITNLDFDGKIIKCTTDNTRNLYGRDYFKKYGKYTKISKNELNVYILIDETGKYNTLWFFQE